MTRWVTLEAAAHIYYFDNPAMISNGGRGLPFTILVIEHIGSFGAHFLLQKRSGDVRCLIVPDHLYVQVLRCLLAGIIQLVRSDLHHLFIAILRVSAKQPVVHTDFFRLMIPLLYEPAAWRHWRFCPGTSSSKEHLLLPLALLSG